MPDRPLPPQLTDQLNLITERLRNVERRRPEIPEVVFPEIPQAGGPYTITVAAADTPGVLKERADFVCDGTADQVEINLAIEAAASSLGLGGKVQLMVGQFGLTDSIVIPPALGFTLSGVGIGTLLASGGIPNPMVHIEGGTNNTISELWIDTGFMSDAIVVDAGADFTTISQTFISSDTGVPAITIGDTTRVSIINNMIFRGDIELTNATDVNIQGNWTTLEDTLRVTSGDQVQIVNNIVGIIELDSCGSFSISSNTLQTFFTEKSIILTDCHTNGLVQGNNAYKTIELTRTSFTNVSDNICDGAFSPTVCVLLDDESSENQVVGNRLAFALGGTAIRVSNDSNQNDIQTNSIRGNVADPAIEITTADCDDNLICNNMTIGTSGVSDSGTGTVLCASGGGPPSPPLASGTVTDETTPLGVSPASGVAASYSRGDHTHGTPVGAVAGASAVGDAAAAGVLNTISRSDHKHSREAFGTVVTETTFGQASANGVATTISHSDHTHGTPAAPTAGHVIEEEGTPLTQRANMNFVGAGVTATDAGGKTVVTIPGTATINGHVIEEEGTPLTQRANMNFVGAGVTAADSGGKTVVTVSTGAGLTPADSVVSETSFGQAAAIGVNTTEFAREDHTHGTPTAPTGASFIAVAKWGTIS